MEQVNKDIQEIKNGMLAHNVDDKNQFFTINEKLDRNHDIHIRNEEILKKILEQATRTNGRVAKLEEVSIKQDKTIALLSQVSSQQEQTSKTFVTKEEFDPYKRIVSGGVALILVLVVGALVGLVIIK